MAGIEDLGFEDLLDEDMVEMEGAEDMVDVEDMIKESLKELGFEQHLTQDLSRVQSKMRSLERKQREVNRIFTECKDILSRHNKGSEIPEAAIVCGSDSEDDDIEVIKFDKSGVKLQIQPGVHKSLLQQRPPQTSPSKPGQTLLKHPLAPMPPTGYRTKHRLIEPKPSLNYQLPPQITSILINTAQGQKQIRPTLPQPSKPIDLAIGMKLFGKKSSINDTWHKGTLVDIQNKEAIRSQHRYKMKFDGKGMKILNGKNIAYSEHPIDVLPVGSRVIGNWKNALYKDEEAPSSQSFYAGIVAEPPSVRNVYRYLVFFDDGYAQYCTAHDLHKVYEQSKNVWEDIHPDSQEFIKGYLQQYPERPMVRLQKGQVVKTEWNGRWWVARVQEVDASLVKMYFEADQRVEWIYRGSTRLEPLYTELANAEASKLAGKGRRHNLHMKSNRKPLVEYTRGVDRIDDELKKAATLPISHQPQTVVAGSIGPVQPDFSQKKKPVARKSTANKSAVRQTSTETPPESPLVSATQWWEKKLAKPTSPQVVQKEKGPDVIDIDSEEALGERVGIGKILPVRDRKKFVTHLCGNHCITEYEQDISKLKASNPLLYPQLCGWERQIAKQTNTGKRVVFYRSPCGRRMRDLEETDYFLMMTNSQLTVDYFCFDPNVHTDTEYAPVKTFCDIKDLSYGKENVPISCVNGIDRQYPDYVEYSNQRIPAKGVTLNLDEEFLAGCSCTDGCRDPNKCACIQQSYAATKTTASLAKDTPEECCYEFRRLREPQVSGVFECNSRCKCDHRCLNRVAQNGLQLRLQVFKTEKRGWGLRCLDDIPSGGFICVYAGQLLTEQGANEDGQQYGDEYLAELDYIEVVERTKEGYESDANEDEGIDADKDEDSDGDYKAEESDSTYSGERRYLKRAKAVKSTVKTAVRSAVKESVKESAKESAEAKEMSGKQKTQEWLDSLTLNDNAIVISDEETENGRSRRKASQNQKKEVSNSKSSASAKSASQTDQVKTEKVEEGLEGLKITEPTSLNTDDIDLEESDEENGDKKDGKLRRSTRSTTGTSRFHNLPDPKSQKPVSPLKINLSSMQVTKHAKKEERKARRASRGPQKFQSCRELFGEEFCYVMDAKSMGNLGRYLNHSCTPNAFVQNVFVDTHDLRFPWVAFFAYNYIRAGTELTWDYNYEVGSVPGKILYCYCGSAECRGRLL